MDAEKMALPGDLAWKVKHLIPSVVGMVTLSAEEWDFVKRALSPPASDEESRAITALKVTLFEVECYLPSSIAKKVQAACQPASAAVVPEGWVLVPLVPTEDMVVAGFESEPDACFSPLEAWLEYEAMTGCRQAAHRAKLCYDAMLAATPSPPVGEKGVGS